MLTLNVILGYQGPSYSRLLVICFYVFFFQSDRPTQYQEMHSTLNENKKKGDGLTALKKSGLSHPSCSVGPNEYVHIFLLPVF